MNTTPYLLTKSKESLQGRLIDLGISLDQIIPFKGLELYDDESLLEKNINVVYLFRPGKRVKKYQF